MASFVILLLLHCYSYHHYYHQGHGHIQTVVACCTPMPVMTLRIDEYARCMPRGGEINPVAAQREFENLEEEMIAADIDLLRRRNGWRTSPRSLRTRNYIFLSVVTLLLLGLSLALVPNI